MKIWRASWRAVCRPSYTWGCPADCSRRDDGIRKGVYWRMTPSLVVPPCLYWTLLDASNWQLFFFFFPGAEIWDRLLLFLREPSGADSLSCRFMSPSLQSASQSPSICTHLLCPPGFLNWVISSQSAGPSRKGSEATEHQGLYSVS